MENEVAKTDREQAAFWKEQFTQLKTENEQLRIELGRLRHEVQVAADSIGEVLAHWPVSLVKYTNVTGGVSHEQGGDSPRTD